MAAQTWTYSLRRPLNKTSGTRNTEKGEELFDKIIEKGQEHDDSDSMGLHQKHLPLNSVSKRKTRNKKNKKSKAMSAEENVPEEMPDESLKLFQEETSVERKKSKKTVQALCRQKADVQVKRYIREMQNLQDINEENRSSLSSVNSENEDVAEGLMIENVRSPFGNLPAKSLAYEEGSITKRMKFRRGMNRNKSSKEDRARCDARKQKHPLKLIRDASGVKSNGSTDDSSIEIARESIEPVMGYDRPLLRSPLIPITRSDDESLDSSVRTGKKSELGWVTISTGRLRDSGTSSIRTGDEVSPEGSCTSQYTYSFVSTYTAGTGTSSGTVSTKQLSSSPPVKIKKLHPQLNSTTYKGKDDIGTVEFPDFISPVCPLQEATPSGKPTNNWVNVRKHKVKSESLTRSGRAQAKCSTMLFASDCSNVPALGSEILTTIHSRGTCASATSSVTGVRSENKDKVSSTKKTPPQHNSANSAKRNRSFSYTQTETLKDNQGQHGNVLKASTPQNTFVPTSFTLSPIGPPSFDEDEGPQVIDSVEVNSDEIIVPSLMEPTVLSGDSGRNEMILADPVSCAASHGNKSKGKADLNAKEGIITKQGDRPNEPATSSETVQFTRKSSSQKLTANDTNMNPPDACDVNSNLISAASATCKPRVEKEACGNVTNENVNSNNRHVDGNDPNGNFSCDDIPAAHADQTAASVKNQTRKKNVARNSGKAQKTVKWKRTCMSQVARSSGIETSEDSANSVTETSSQISDRRTNDKDGNGTQQASDSLRKKHTGCLPKICFINRLCMRSQYQMRSKVIESIHHQD